MTEVRIRVMGKPQPQGSTRAFPYRRADGGLGAHVTSDNPRLNAWRATVAKAARVALGAGVAAFVGAVELAAVFELSRPKRRTGRDYPIVRPDLDKLARAVLDALTGIVWVDDAQVIALHARKVYIDGDDPHTVILVKPIGRPHAD